MKLLIWKTVFLTLLASGGRRVEVHTLDYKSLKQDPKWKYIVAKPHEGFISKTQLCSHGATRLESFTIRGLVDFVRPDLDRDSKLCPVRYLKTYLARTQDRRQGTRLLFVSYKKDFGKDIYENTISGWIRKLTSYCYKHVSESSRGFVNTSTHAICGMTASLPF